MNTAEIEYRYNFISFWRNEYAIYNHGMSRSEFWQWCTDRDNLNEFISVYYDWSMNGFDMQFKPQLSGHGKDMKWIGG